MRRRAPQLSRASARSSQIGLDLHVDSKAYIRRMPTTFQIAEVAQRSGFTPATLRYYEDIGLVAPASRSEAGYRLYDETSLDRLRFIARAKQLGCSLEEIAELTTVWDGGRCVNVQRRLRETVEAKITDARSQIAELTSLTSDLQRAAATLSAQPVEGPCDDTCGCTIDPSASSPTAVPLVAMADATAASADRTADEVPIACTLGADEMSTRIDEWNAVLQGVTARHPLAGGLRVEFGRDSDVTEIARLAAAEQGCCRFFEFALVLDGRGVALEFHAPSDGQPVLTALFGDSG
jgi:MerR family transcriptional regulator, copper efflux regulator